MMIPHEQMVIRIAAGAFLGGIIGYERDRHRRPVGLRTHLIVAMTAATFMVISSQFVYFQSYHEGDFVEVDASRIAASVVSAIGFLAGGAIFRNGLTVQGLTTAAGLWLVTAIGMCAGAGMFLEAVIVTGMGITALTVLRRFEDKNVVRRRLSVVLGEESSGPAGLLAALRELGVSVNEVEYEKRLDDDKKPLVVKFQLQMSDAMDAAKLIETVERVTGVKRIHIQHE